MTNNRRIRQIASFASALLALTLTVAQFSVSQEKPQPLVTKAQLKGTWTATLSGYTGCGETTLTTTFTLDSTGNGTQTSAVEHTLGCGDIDQTGQVAQIQALNADGSGFIAFGCGAGCGFGFNIQVAKNKQVFNLGPQLVSGNFLAGVAVRK
jgi:hypothetical protein